MLGRRAESQSYQLDTEQAGHVENDVTSHEPHNKG